MRFTYQRISILHYTITTTTTKLMQMHSVLHCILLMMSWPLSFVNWTKNQGEQRSEQTQRTKKVRQVFFCFMRHRLSLCDFLSCFFTLKHKWRKLTNRDARKHMPAPEFMSFWRSIRAIFLFLVLLCANSSGYLIFYIGTTFWKFRFFLCFIITEAETKSSFKMNKIWATFLQLWGL